MMRVPNSMVAAAGAAVALVPVRVWAQGPSDPVRYGYYGPHMMGWDGGWYGMIFGPLFMILVLAMVIAVAVLLVRWLGGPWHGNGITSITPASRTRSTSSRSASPVAKSTRRSSRSAAACSATESVRHVMMP